MEVVLAIIGCITLVSVTDKVLRHRREMAKIKAAQPTKADQADIQSDLRALLQSYQQTSTEFDLSLESNQQHLARRLDSIEQRLREVEHNRQEQG